MLSESLPAAAQGTHLWLQSQMEEFEKGTPDGVAIESDGHLRQSPGLTELAHHAVDVRLVTGRWKRRPCFCGNRHRRLRCCVSPNGKGEKPFTLFETRDLSVQALCIGPDGALYAATVPSGKVYKLNPNATTKHDENSATVVFDAAKAAQSASGRKPSRPQDSGSRRSLHLGSHLRLVGTPLYRDRQSRRRLSRRSQQTRRSSGVLLQER